MKHASMVLVVIIGTSSVTSYIDWSEQDVINWITKILENEGLNPYNVIIPFINEFKQNILQVQCYHHFNQMYQ